MIAGNSRRYGTSSSFTHSPISGRLSTTSMRLPIHMLATRPQNRSGRSVITSGPGWMPWMVRAPSISAITPLAGRPRVSMGMNLHWASALLADSGPATPSMAPRPKREGSRGELLLHHVGGKRGDRRSGAGQHAEERADRGAAQDRAERLLHVVPGREQMGDLGSEHPAFLGIAEIADDLAHGEHADRDHDEADAVAQVR